MDIIVTSLVVSAALSTARFAVTTEVTSQRRVEFSEISKLVEDRNVNVQLSRAEADVARGKLAEARTKLRFTISGTNKFSENTQTTKNQGTNRSTTTDFVASENTIMLSQDLDLFGKSRAAVARERANVMGSEATIRENLNSQIAEAQISYLSLAGAEALLVGAEADLKSARLRLENTIRRFEAGLLPELNVLQARSDVSSYTATVSTRIADVQKARIRLSVTLGLPVSEADSLEIAPMPGAENLPGLPESLEAVRDWQHPGVLVGQFGVEAADHGLSLAKKSQLPTINLSASYGVNNSKSQFALERQGYLSLSISMPINDAGQRKAQVATETANLASAKWRLESTNRSLESELRQAIADYTANLSALSSSRDAYAAAAESVRVAEVRYQQGIATSGILEVQSAQASLIRARNQMLTAYYGSLQSMVLVQKAIGKPGLAMLPQG
jgi:multidrug efflux system outer membrane protein